MKQKGTSVSRLKAAKGSQRKTKGIKRALAWSPARHKVLKKDTLGKRFGKERKKGAPANMTWVAVLANIY